MAMVSKTRDMIEGLVRDGSFKWLLKNRSPFHEEFEEMGKSPSTEKNWVPELSPVANIVVRRCSKILGVSMIELRENFDAEASEFIKEPSRYARNFLEYSCFRALALSTQVPGYLEDKKFRRLTFDMMLAWEFPAVADQPSLNMDEDTTVGVEAFSRIAPGVPIIANVIISDNIFELLTASTGGRLQFNIYEKYLSGLERYSICPSGDLYFYSLWFEGFECMLKRVTPSDSVGYSCSSLSKLLMPRNSDNGMSSILISFELFAQLSTGLPLTTYG